MSLRVNRISNVDDNGPIEFTNGVIVPAGQSITPAALVINSTGVVTATSYSGSGSGITNLTGITASNVYSVVSII